MDADEIRQLSQKVWELSNVEVKAGEMSPRDRYYAIMDFKKPDRIIDTEFGYWNDTLRRWKTEGLPAWVKDNSDADLYFGFDVWKKGIPINTDIAPFFEVETVSDDGRTKVIYDPLHIKCQVFSDGTDTIPHYIDFPIKDRDSYVKLYKPRLDPSTPGRLPANLAEIGEKVRNRNYVLEIFFGSTAGWLRNWMGFEGICLSIYDQPELIDEILQDIGHLENSLAQEVVKHVVPDFLMYWEDIAFKTGPIVPPKFYREKCGPILRKSMEVFAKAGTRFGMLDCDGDMRSLVPTWLESGINIMFPLEVNSGVHPENLRKQFPGIRMMGGFDKVILLEGPAAIKKELLRLKPLVEEGGFVPHVDHRVQADVSLKNYLYYLEAKRDIFGIPNKILETG
jgi:uroporphyrinogen decarboxylase